MGSMFRSADIRKSFERVSETEKDGINFVLHPLITSSPIGYPYLFITCHLVSCDMFRFNLGDSWHIICFIK